MYGNKALTASQCLELGFNSDSLACQTCDYVGQVFGDKSEPNTSCLSCCIRDSNSVEEVFAKAVLEIDKRFVKFLPELEFVVKNKRKYKLNVRYREGPPRLLMYKEKGDEEAQETVSVGSWNRDALIDYLSSHIKN